MKPLPIQWWMELRQVIKGSTNLLLLSKPVVFETYMWFADIIILCTDNANWITAWPTYCIWSLHIFCWEHYPMCGQRPTYYLCSNLWCLNLAYDLVRSLSYTDNVSLLTMRPTYCIWNFIICAVFAENIIICADNVDWITVWPTTVVIYLCTVAACLDMSYAKFCVISFVRICKQSMT